MRIVAFKSGFLPSKSEKSLTAAVENCGIWSSRNQVSPKDFPDGKVPLPYCGADNKPVFVPLGPRSDFGTEHVDYGYCSACHIQINNHRSFPAHVDRCPKKPPDLNQTNMGQFFKVESKRGNDDASTRGSASYHEKGEHNTQIPVDAGLSLQQVRFVKWVCSCNISLRSVTNEEFREFLSGISPDFHLQVSRKTLRKQILDYSAYLQEKMFSPGSRAFGKPGTLIIDPALRYPSGGLPQYVSLIADGMTWADRALYVVVAFTPAQLYFVDLVHVPATDHETIATEIAGIVKKMDERGVKVRSICTDNAANLVRAFDSHVPHPLEQRVLKDTLSAKVNRVIVHVRCSVHTMHLVYSDMKKGCPGFVAFKDWVKKMLQWLRTPEPRKALRDLGVTAKVPRIQEIKWCTYSQGSAFLYENKDAICGLVIRRRAAHDRTVVDWYDDPYMLDIVRRITEFIRRTEGSYVCLPEMYHKLIILIEGLESERNNRYAEQVCHFVRQRFEETADGTLAELAYIFTAEGFAWFKKRRNQMIADFLRDKYPWPGEEPLSEEQKVFRRKRAAENERTALETDQMIQKLRDVGVMFFQNAQDLSILFGDYLESDGPSASRILDEWWLAYAYHPMDYREPTGNCRVIYRTLFAKTARAVMDLPASEAVCERVFSQFRALFPSSREWASDDLTRAQMRIKLAHRWSMGDARTAGLGSAVPDKKGVTGKQKVVPPRTWPVC
jgi:hypothetical protein